MNAPAGKIRLIGGRWRGTRLDVPSAPGLRPTADRVRETLFNWLMPYLPGSRVLDLFAGTGALGLESLSRGAAMAVLIERDAALAAALRSTLGRLEGGARGSVIHGDALAWLVRETATFDIAFVDPPFAGDLWPRVWPALSARLAPGALVHVECPVDVDPRVPTGWRPHREGRTREVRHMLYRVPAPPTAAATLDPDPAAGVPSS
ncbi:16S rRNA (guanine(966)-N(2))-methyltransferase RsmD [Cognatilysobacter lacus]|uniref:Ribosomal RNA small subunit methyltransferase D n=1 Tax=Cognatilysobacter lacus TaxID=1643323 RepID=A0A5D8YP53_9GAMM|nr:16S rRNA (guanine(966)-N(2))-methyltransferase RsmD [Lysobacter lacus]TZF84160.1 16S rRNA (guanine(966)-N(2))-methyltransferase RsmD [Lysobacter lacus]